MEATVHGISTGRQIWNFTRHFVEMVAAMCIGGGILNALVFVAGPRLLGYQDPRVGFPAASLLLIAVIYSLPMAAWMRYRNMEWRPILEMVAATVGLAVALIALAAVGVLAPTSLRGWALAFCMPACGLMLPVMLFRLDLYTGRGGHQHAGERTPVAHVS